MADDDSYLFATCQVGAGGALKAEVARNCPDLRLSFSRPGFVTFKRPSGESRWETAHRNLVFARVCGESIGKLTGETCDALADAFWEKAAEYPHHAIHVWERDVLDVGRRGFEPGVSAPAQQAADAIARRAPRSETGEPQFRQINTPAARGQSVLDCIVIDPHLWWLGHHTATTVAGRAPGGLLPVEAPELAVSRAFLKMEEALQWSRLPLRAGDPCVELGCAPGGASQALLARGLIVNGIDPADVDPVVLAHPDFRHLRMRASDLRRKEFRGVRWLAADMNVAPSYTLDAVEEIVTFPGVRLRGLLLTLKFPDWRLAEQVPSYLDRVRSWGFREVKAWQLPHNRQEICLSALRRRSLRRLTPDGNRRRGAARATGTN